jgi:hypothetical protein
VVGVEVADHHGVDAGRQVLDGEVSVAVTGVTDQRVEQHGAVAALDQHGRVVEVADPDLPGGGRRVGRRRRVVEEGGEGRPVLVAYAELLGELRHVDRGDPGGEQLIPERGVKRDVEVEALRAGQHRAAVDEGLSLEGRGGQRDALPLPLVRLRGVHQLLEDAERGPVRGVVDQLDPAAEAVRHLGVERLHGAADGVLPQQPAQGVDVVGELEPGPAVLDHQVAQRLHLVGSGAAGVEERRAVAVRVRGDRVVQVGRLQIAVHNGQQPVAEVERAGVRCEQVRPGVPPVQQGLRDHGRAEVELLVCRHASSLTGRGRQWRGPLAARAFSCGIAGNNGSLTSRHIHVYQSLDHRSSRCPAPASIDKEKFTNHHFGRRADDRKSLRDIDHIAQGAFPCLTDPQRDTGSYQGNRARRDRVHSSPSAVACLIH